MRNKRIMFIRVMDPNRWKHCHPYNRKSPLQIGYMISLLKKEYKVSFLDGWIARYPLDLLLRKTNNFNSSVAVLSFIANDRQFTLKYATKAKEFAPHIKIICIGPDASTLPEALIFKGSPIDFVLRGECELDLLELLGNFDSPENLKRIRSLYYKEKRQAEIALIENPDRLPMPQHFLFRFKDYISIYLLPLNFELRWGYILSSRGCPHQCMFCSPVMRSSYGLKVRFRSIKNVIEEMLYLKSLGINIVSFEDDDFTISRERTIELCREMIDKKIDLAWIAHARITELSKDLMAAMKAAGCVLLRVGIESGSNRVINILSKTKKMVDWSKVVQKVFKEAKKVNLLLHAMFIIGSPDEEEADLNLTIKLIKKIEPNSIQVHYFAAYPGSRVFTEYWCNRKFDTKIHHYNPLEIMNLSRIETKRLKTVQRRMYRSFYLSLPFIVKHIKYYRFYLHNPKVIIKGIKGLI